MNGLWMKSAAVVAAMMGLSALATAGAPARVRPSRVVGPARAWARVGVWDDTDIAHVARPNALRAQLTPIRDGTSNTLKAQARSASLYDSPGNDTPGVSTIRRRAKGAGIQDGTSNTLLPHGLHDDTVGAGLNRYDSAGDDTVTVR